jgi:hypothetical protein
MIFNVSDDKKYLLVGLLTVLIALWSLFYGIPSLLYSILNSILGNLILLVIIILLALYNPLYSVIFAVIAFFLIRLVKVKEGFSWTERSINDFIALQDTVNRNRFFDIGKLQEHTSQKEVDYYLKYGVWPWTDQTTKWYENASNKNVYVQTYSKDSVMDARKVYPEFAILQIMALQEKEGDFLTNGVVVYDPLSERDGRGSYPYNSGQIALKDRQDASFIRCDYKTNKILETKNGQTREVPPEEIEQKIPGFKFKGAPCNICTNINDEKYNCPFTFHNRPTSSVWDWFWSQEK